MPSLVGAWVLKIVYDFDPNQVMSQKFLFTITDIVQVTEISD